MVPALIRTFKVFKCWKLNVCETKGCRMSACWLHPLTQAVLVSAPTGEAQQAGLPQPVPLQRLLRLRQAEGAGVPEHRVDRRVHRPAAPRQDRQLHPHLLTPQCSRF